MTTDSAGARRLSVAFVLPYGEASESFFPDALLEHLCALARERGHDARIVRVYYDGRDRARDDDVRARLGRWLAERAADLIVVERLFDAEPIRAHVAADVRRRAVMMSWGDGDLVEGVDLVVGRTPGLVRGGTTRRSPSAGELAQAFLQLLDAIARGDDPSSVPGVARNVDGKIRSCAPPLAAPLLRPFRAALDHDVISAAPAPQLTRKYVFGNAGCPFALDPKDNPHYAGAPIPADAQIARLGCAFCHFGGDYQKRPDEALIDEMLEQAAYYLDHAPGIRELVLGDQHAIRTLAPLLRAANARGLRPTRWLFSARADTWVREGARVRDAMTAAREGGHTLELYLSGFEALSDRELARYNKGVTVAELLTAVEAMRARRREAPDTFEYARARGHSLILWNPWTSPDDLAETVANVRAHGLCELFTDLAKNRLRLYPDLPITYAAERDGALVDEWDELDEGAARRKGYSVERPWRFLDVRTRLAHALARSLRDHLGPETQLPQLAAIVDDVRGTWGELSSSDAPRIVEGVLSELRQLEQSLPPPPPGRQAQVVAFAGSCNNGCTTCGNRDAWFDDDDEALFARVDHARARGGPLVFAGREPTVHPSFLRLIARAHHGERDVGIVGNGRRFAYRAFSRAAVGAGLRAASLKLFAPDAARADAIARVPGAFEQGLSGARELRRAGVRALELRAPLHRDALETFEAFADLAARSEVRRIRVEVALDAVGLGRLALAAAAVGRLRVRAFELGLAVFASPISAGARGFDTLPDVSDDER